MDKDLKRAVLSRPSGEWNDDHQRTDRASSAAAASRSRLPGFGECVRRYQPRNPPVLEKMVFGIGFSVAPIGKQANNLEAIPRAAANQDCHRHRVITV